MSERTCPVNGCGRALGTTKYGDPLLLCPRHWAKVPAPLQAKLWRAYRSWQRLERQRRNGPRPPARALLLAIAVAIRAYLDVRDSAIRRAAQGEARQLEVAL